MNESKVCPHCKQVFTKQGLGVPTVEWRRRIFCSRACRDKSRRVHMEKVCPQCGKTFERREDQNWWDFSRQTFCSKSCATAARWNTPGSPMRTPKPRQGPQKKTRQCVQCGKIFTTTVRAQPLCSPECVERWRVFQQRAREFVELMLP